MITKKTDRTIFPLCRTAACCCYADSVRVDAFSFYQNGQGRFRLSDPLVPEEPRWQNYIDIWVKIPLLTFIKNTFKLTIIVTVFQILTSSFAAYAFAKLRFKGRDLLFLAYIGTIAIPWQVYMVPQFMMMRSFGLNNTHLALIWLRVMLPLSKPALSTLVIFTFVGTWNDFLGPMIYLPKTVSKCSI